MTTTCPTTPYEKTASPFASVASPFNKIADSYDKKHFCDDALLQENGYFILLEDGGLILL